MTKWRKRIRKVADTKSSPSTLIQKSIVFKLFHSGERFQKVPLSWIFLCILVWTEAVSVTIKLRFQIYPGASVCVYFARRGLEWMSYNYNWQFFFRCLFAGFCKKYSRRLITELTFCDLLEHKRWIIQKRREIYMSCMWYAVCLDVIIEVKHVCMLCSTQVLMWNRFQSSFSVKIVPLSAFCTVLRSMTELRPKNDGDLQDATSTKRWIVK